MPEECRDLFLSLTAQLDVGRDQSVAVIEHHAVVLQKLFCSSGATAESDFSFVLKDTPGFAIKATSFPSLIVNFVYCKAEMGTHRHTHTYTHARTHTRTHTHARTHSNTHTYAHTYTHTHTHTHTHIHARTHALTCAHTDTHSLTHTHTHRHSLTCLLYTSDAADERLCVDLGGRRIIKKGVEQIPK